MKLVIVVPVRPFLGIVCHIFLPWKVDGTSTDHDSPSGLHVKHVERMNLIWHANVHHSAVPFSHPRDSLVQSSWSQSVGTRVPQTVWQVGIVVEVSSGHDDQIKLGKSVLYLLVAALSQV